MKRILMSGQVEMRKKIRELLVWDVDSYSICLRETKMKGINIGVGEYRLIALETVNITEMVLD